MRYVAAVIATGLLLVFGAGELCAYPLTLEQRQRLKRYLPRSFPKLEARDPVHVVALGDGVMGGRTPLESDRANASPLFSYAGVFLARLAREFFYPGSIHLLNPPEGGLAKLTDYRGDEITLEDLTDRAGTMLTGLRHATTDAFVHDPDLLLVSYGINDAFGNLSIDAYQRALQEIIDAGDRNRSDIVVLGPTIVNYGGGAMEWGITRPYSMAAEEIAAANGVLFIDLGKILGKYGGGINPDTHPEAAMEIVGDRLGRIFEFGPELERPEKIHLAPRAHEFLGQAVFDELKDGPKKPKFTAAAVAEFEGDDAVNVNLILRNQSSDPMEGSIGALAVGAGLLPKQAAKRFTVPADGTTQVDFGYERPGVGKARDGADLPFPWEPSDAKARFGFVLEDTLGSEFVDLPVRVGPVTAVWESRQFINVGGKIRVEWDLVNGTDSALSGTFQAGMADKVGDATSFSVSPLGTKSVFALFDFDPADASAQFQQDLWIQLDVGGEKIRFTREMEASRDLVLGEEMAMRAWEEYVNAEPAGDNAARRRPEGEAAVRFEADEDALYLTIRLEGVEVPDLGDSAALKARLFLDARPASEVRSFGVVAPVEIYLKAADGPGRTPRLPLGCFGNGYNMILSPKGIASVLETAGDGSRRLKVRIPRSYLHRHEWALDSPDSMLGFGVELTVADADKDSGETFPKSNSFVTNSPTFAWEDRTIHGFHENDARSLTTLRLTRQPVNSWSVRLY